MITISQVVVEIIRQTPFLEEDITRGLINYSALAREIKPGLERKLLKKIKTGAIIMALRRTSKKIKSKLALKNVFKSTPDMIVRSNLVEFTFINSPSLLTKLRELLEKIEDQNRFFITITQGVFETGVIVSKDLEKRIESIFKVEKVKSKLIDLSSITIKLPEENISTPGVYYFILKSLAWKNINVIEVVSTYHENTLILKTNDVDEAFSILKNSLVI